MNKQGSKNRKLMVARETLRRLSDRQLDAAAGGYTPELSTGSAYVCCKRPDYKPQL